MPATIAGMAAVGPVLGGWLTTSFSWRLIFWINPPLALLVIIGALLLVPESKEPDAPGLRDWVGVLLVSGGLALLVFGLLEGQRYGWWTADDQFMIGSTGLAIVSIPAVLWVFGMLYPQ